MTNMSAVPLQSRQQTLTEIVDTVNKGKCCRVLGPRYRGKSRLVRQVVDRLNNDSTHYSIYQDILMINENYEAALYQNLYLSVLNSVPHSYNTPLVDIQLDTPARFHSALSELLNRTDRSIALFVDNLEMAFPTVVSTLLDTLRAVYNTSFTGSRARFQAVVCGSFQQAGQQGSSSGFARISNLILIGDLDEKERVDLVYDLCREDNIRPTEEGLEALFEQAGGDYFLIRRLCQICVDDILANREKSLRESHVAAATQKILSKDNTFRLIQDTLRPIESDPDLLSNVLEILNKGSVHSSELRLSLEESPNYLDLSGMFVQRNYSYEIKCKLWQRLLEEYLKPMRIGTLYRQAGRWNESLRYFDEAIDASVPGAKTEMLATMVNAIHASKTSREAYQLLGRALQAIYRESDVTIYQRTEQSLVEVFPEPISTKPRRIRLNDPRQEEIKALNSIQQYSGQGADLYIPLKRPDTLGLISIVNRQMTRWNYDQFEETRQIVETLKKSVVEAIVRIQNSEREFDAAQRRGTQLKALNTILMHILSDELEEDVMLRLVLTGITASFGLMFNRAILFWPNSDAMNLEVRLSVGHLEKKEAVSDWGRFKRFKNVEHVIDSIIRGEANHNVSSLQERIAGFAMPLDGSFTKNILLKCFRNGRSELVRQSQSLNRVKLPSELAQRIEPVTDFALIPFKAGSRTLGVLYVDSKFTEQEISPERFELLITFVNQAALIMESRTEAKRQSERRQTVVQVAKTISKLEYELSAVFSTILEAVLKAVPHADNACIVELNESTQCLVIPEVCKAFYAYADWPPSGDLSFAGQQGIAGRVISSGKPEIVGDITDDADYIRAIKDTRSQASVPIYHNETVSRALVLESNIPRAFTYDDMHLLEALADQIGIGSQYHMQYTELETKRKEETDQKLREWVADLAVGAIHDIDKYIVFIPELIDDLVEALSEKEYYTDNDIQKHVERLRERISETRTIGNRLHNLVLTRQFKPRLEPINYYIRRACEKEQARNPGNIDLTFHENDLNPIIWIDPGWFEPVIQNLISNAFLAILEKQRSYPEERGAVEISVEEQPDYVVIRVVDNGIGIEKQDGSWDHIFEAGYSTRREQGHLHGIGLYFCRKVIEHHKGTLKVTASERNIGSTLTIFLPTTPLTVGDKGS